MTRPISKLPLLLPLALALISVGCAQTAPRDVAKPATKIAVKPDAVPMPVGDAARAEMAPPAVEPPAPEKLPTLELTGQILYQTLLGEIAAERGDVALTLRAYQELARNTRDPRIVRRAAELGLAARQPEYALDAARLWADIDPESTGARQMLAGILVGLNRLDEATPHVAKLIAQEGPNTRDAVLRLNRLFARAPDKGAARRAVETLTQPYLALPEAHFARSEAAAADGDGAGALAAIAQAIVLRPDWEIAVLQKAQLQREINPPAATETLRAFLDAYPNAREVRLNYARALAGDRRLADARVEFEKLRREFPDNADVLYAVGVLSLQLNDLETAAPVFRQLLEKGYTEPNQLRMFLGQISEERKQPDEALGWYRAITPGEQYLNAQLRMANVLAQQGRVEEARASLQNATASTPRERVQLLMAEAQVLRDAGQEQASYEFLELARASQPDDPDLLYETALAAERVGRVELTESYLRKLIGIKPDHAHALNALGYSLADRNDRLDEAHTLITQALKLAPEDPFILDSMGWVLFRRGDANAALQYLTRAHTQRADPEIAAHLGEVLWSVGKSDDARRVWRDAVAASPSNAVLNQTIKRFIP